jgi:hypothetical protein
LFVRSKAAWDVPSTVGLLYDNAPELLELIQILHPQRRA